MTYPFRRDTHPRAAWPDHLTHLEPIPMPTYTWTAPASGKFSLTFANLDQCRRCADPGPRDLDVADLATDPAIAAQLAAIDPQQLVQELDGYGAWSDEELTDHAQNLQRVLWVAGVDVWENPSDYVSDEVAP